MSGLLKHATKDQAKRVRVARQDRLEKVEMRIAAKDFLADKIFDKGLPLATCWPPQQGVIIRFSLRGDAHHCKVCSPEIFRLNRPRTTALGLPHRKEFGGKSFSLPQLLPSIVPTFK